MSKQNLLLLFDRPQEPVFAPKGSRQAAFEVSQDFLVSSNFFVNKRLM